MSVVLVTGGAGFIGSHLCEKLLEKGYHVINIDNFNDFYDPKIKRNNIIKASASPNYSLIEGDIRDYSLLESAFQKSNIDIVIHLAALAGVRNSIQNPLDYIDVDIKGTVTLLELCNKYKIKKFIFASSSSVYGLNKVPFNEEDIVISQVSPYATAKQSGELYCRTYNSLYHIPTVCLRFFTVYGPRQRPEMVIHKFTGLIAEGKEISLFGSGTSARDYTYIDDIINGIIAAMDLQCDFEVINLGNSRSIQLDYLIGLIEKNLNKYAYKRFLPAQPGDVELTYADISKARNMLKYSPVVSIEDGVQRFVNWYRQKLKDV